MFGKRKNDQESRPRKGAALMNQLGYGNMMGGDNDEDEDLEAELLALQGGAGKPKSKTKKQEPVSMAEIDRIAAGCMKDFDDEDISDTEDPDLLAELQEMEEDSDEDDNARTPSPSSHQAPSAGNVVSLLEDRLNMYKQAVENAKSAGDSSKERRLARGLKTLQDLCKKAKAGRAVSEDDIPPAVAVGSSTTTSKPPAPQSTPSPVPVYEPTLPQRESSPQPAPRQSPQPAPRRSPQPAPQPSPQPRQPSLQLAPRAEAPAPPAVQTQSDNKDLIILQTRQHEYKVAAVKAKQSGDKETAVRYVKISKQFDQVIQAVKDGKPVDLSQMPDPPGAPGENKQVQSGSHQASVQRAEAQGAGNEEAVPELTAEQEKEIFKAPEAPKTVMEALQQRLEKYQASESSAKAAGEGSKARRHGRVVKQYQDAIKATKAGKAFDYEELPTPPGYAPIPVGGPVGSAPQSAQKPAPAPAPAPVAAASLQPGQAPAKARTPSPNRQPAQKPAQQQTPPTLQTQTSRNSLKKSPSSRAEQQIYFLQERVTEYKMAAVKAKRNNDLELAKKYMRIAKGIEPMIEAAEGGLPVDLSQVPPSLTEDDEVSIVTVTKEEVPLSGDRQEVFKKLQQDLVSQIRTSATNQQHFTKLGDVLNAAKFQKMEQGCRRDLDALKNAFRHNDPVPKFHYENRTFSLVQCNTDLGDNDLELTVVRGIQLPTGHAEKDLDTYVKYEFPYPNDEPQSGQTDTVKGSVNPEYGEPCKLQIERKSRGFLRVVERKAVKLEVFQKRGFFKGDKSIGTCNVKLLPLDSKCTIHDSYDLTEGRKSVGGKLEVKIRIRDPFKAKQVEEMKEKWLVIDQFLRTINPTAPKPSGESSGGSAIKSGSTCIEVLRYEKQQLDAQISSLRDRLSSDQIRSLNNKSKLLQQKMDEQQAFLKQGGTKALQEYVHQVEMEIPGYEEEARHLAKAGDMHKAQIMLTKCKHAQKELTAIKAKFPGL